MHLYKKGAQPWISKLGWLFNIVYFRFPKRPYAGILLFLIHGWMLAACTKSWNVMHEPLKLAEAVL